MQNSMHIDYAIEAAPQEPLTEEVLLSADEDTCISPCTLVEEDIPAIGRNCRINIVDRHEILRLNEELEDLQRWFEEFGQDGILFPHSIINSFAPSNLSQAA